MLLLTYTSTISTAAAWLSTVIPTLPIIRTAWGPGIRFHTAIMPVTASTTIRMVMAKNGVPVRLIGNPSGLSRRRLQPSDGRQLDGIRW